MRNDYLVLEDVLRVWKANLEGWIADYEKFEAILSAGERIRAGRFHFEKDKTRHVICQKKFFYQIWVR
jgi:hypothetical protein